MPSLLGTALVTGASSGIGAVYADRLARRGYDLLLVARGRERLEAQKARLAETGRSIETLALDLGDPGCVERAEARLRGDAAITMLLNNAGLAIASPLSLTPAADLDALIRVNVLAATRLAAAAAANFGSHGRGAIINIASVAAFVPKALNAAYPASKAYLLSLTHALHAQLAGKGVRVQAVCPGITLTEIWQKSGIDPSALPSDQAMPVDLMVDAALAGFDLGETVTIPAMESLALYEAFEVARLAMEPHLSRSQPAGRYRGAAPNAA